MKAYALTKRGKLYGVRLRTPHPDLDCYEIQVYKRDHAIKLAMEQNKAYEPVSTMWFEAQNLRAGAWCIARSRTEGGKAFGYLPAPRKKD